MSPPRESVTLRTVAPAKLNWTLEVLGRRSDGYHEIRSVMQTISLTDDLELRPARVSHRITLSVGGPEAAGLDERENLVSRAWSALARISDRPGVSAVLEKRIPVAAGLGGGSSDAAAALRLLSRSWSWPDAMTVRQVAASLGSDVPFFLRGGAQLAEGRGEVLTPLAAGEPVPLILATPPIALPDKTARLYAQLRPHHTSDGAITERVVAKLRAGLPPGREDYINVFDQVAEGVFPDLSRYRRTFERVTGLEPCLAGAGPSLFGVCAPSTDERATAASIAALAREGFRAWFVHTVGTNAATKVDVQPYTASFAP
jgi:4-diphosphocytidyl-2-C-methyl-D-erythritol kinase